MVRVSGSGSGIYVFSSCEGKLGEASRLVMVTIEKAVGEGSIPAAHVAVRRADSMVLAARESTLFLLT